MLVILLLGRLRQEDFCEFIAKPGLYCLTNPKSKTTKHHGWRVSQGVVWGWCPFLKPAPFWSLVAPKKKVVWQRNFRWWESLVMSSVAQIPEARGGWYNV